MALTATFEADFSQFVEAVKDAQLSLTDLTASYVSAEAVIRLADAAWAAFTDTLKASVTAALDAESADAQLTAALTAQGTAMPSVLQAYDEYAKALQATTTYSDDAVKAAEAILVQIGDVMPRDMEQALEATANLATGLKVDLATAANYVAKAAQGQTTALERQAPAIAALIDTNTDFATILDLVNTKFHDQAKAAGETLPGQLKTLENSWDDVQESMGRVITDNETVRTVLGALNDVIKGNTGELKDNATANTLVSEAVILVVKGLRLGIDAVDFFQQELRDARSVVDAFSLGITDAYVTLQKFEKATQTPLAWAGSDEAKKRVEEASAAIERGTAHIAALRADMDQAKTTSAAWSAGLQGLKSNLDGLIAKLETTKGQTRETAAAQAEQADVWQRQTENQKALQQTQDDAAKAAKAQAEAIAELQSVGVSWQDTLTGMDQTLVDTIAHNLEAGASAKTIATAYAVTELQVKAVSQAMKASAEEAKRAQAESAALARLDLELQRARGEASRDTLQAEIDNLEAWGVAQAAAMTKAQTYTQEAYEKITAIVNQSTANIIQKTLEADPLTEAHYRKLAADAELAYSRALQFADQYTVEATEALRDEAEAAQFMLADWQTHANTALQSTADTAHATAGAVRGIGEAFEQTQAQIAGGFPGMAGVSGTLPIDIIEGMKQLGGTTGTNVLRAIPEDVLRNLASGASFVGGGPGGLAGQVQRLWDRRVAQVILESGAITMNYPITSDPRAMDELGRHVGESILKKMTRTGARV